MKCFTLGLLVSSLSVGISFAAGSDAQVTSPVGPAPTAQAKPGTDGSLQVYSARQKHDPSYLWDIFVGGVNDDAQYDPAHTDYTICTPEGKVVEKVRNAHDPNDATPALVSLTPGTYLVKAEDRDYGSVSVPVVIKPGELTQVNLERGKKLAFDQSSKRELVLLHGWRVVGWRAEASQSESRHSSLATHP